MCYNDMRSGKTDAVQNKTLYSFMHSWHDPIACQPRAQPAEGTPSGVSADAEGHTAPAAFITEIQLHTMHSWRNWIACQPPTLKVVGSIPAGCTKAPLTGAFACGRGENPPFAPLRKQRHEALLRRSIPAVCSFCKTGGTPYAASPLYLPPLAHATSPAADIQFM